MIVSSSKINKGEMHFSVFKFPVMNTWLVELMPWSPFVYMSDCKGAYSCFCPFWFVVCLWGWGHGHTVLDPYESKSWSQQDCDI